MANLYAILGVRPNSSRAAIRSAYVQLMRCYHPDRNSSAAAAAKVREINAAYAVLGDNNRRDEYDRHQAAMGRQTRVREAAATTIDGNAPGAKQSPWFALAAVSVLLLLLVPFYVAPLAPLPAPEVESDVARPVRAAQAGIPDRAQFINDPCSSTAATAAVQRQLIGAAARLADQNGSMAVAQFYKSLRLQLKGAEKNGRFPDGERVHCVAAVALELTPGLGLDEARPRLIGTIGYDIRWADESGRSSIELKQEAKHIVRFLAGLATQATQAVQSTHEMRTVQAPQVTELRLAALSAPPRQAATVASPRLPSATAVRPPQDSKPLVQAAEPSFGCGSARSRATQLICGSPQLAALDRQLASVWGDAMATASGSDRSRLLQSDRRFLARRDACSSEICVRDEYSAQISQVRSVRGNQQP